MAPPSDHAAVPQHLLREGRAIRERHAQRDAATGRRFNLLRVLAIETDEVRCHSRFLADLLNPAGLHGLGARPAHAILGSLVPASAKGASEGAPSDDGPASVISRFLEASTWSTRTEVALPSHDDTSGRMDIVLELTEGGRRYQILVENKIHAADQHGQLARYWSYGKKACGSTAAFELWYLTLEGSDPSERAVEGLADDARAAIRCLSHAETVASWVCQLAEGAVGRVRDALLLYLETLNRLTGRLEDDILNDLKNLIATPDDLAAAWALSEALRVRKLELQLTFWTRLHAQVTQLYPDRKVSPPPTKAQVADYTRPDRSRLTRHGLHVPIHSTHTANLALKVEVANNTYLRIVSLGEPGSPEWTAADRVQTQCALGSPWVNDSEGVWRYAGSDVPRLNFRNPDETCWALASDEGLEAAVNAWTREFKVAFDDAERVLGGGRTEPPRPR